jgi:ketosteroid isomerase-like protein
MIEALFKAIDEKDPVKFSNFITDDCLFRFGNLEAVRGVDAIQAFLQVFYDSIDSLSHALDEHWEIPCGVVCQGFTTYTRKDGSTLTVPFANILKTRNGKIYEYLIFADTSDLYG